MYFKNISLLPFICKRVTLITLISIIIIMKTRILKVHYRNFKLLY